MNKDDILNSSMARLLPTLNKEEALATLLLGQVRRNLVKYRTMDRHFQKKYQTTFAEFREKVLSSEMSYEVEQDYFDWELAITGIEEMEEEISRLESLL